MATVTLNQLSVLLDISRGTFRPDRHMGTVATDLLSLAHLGLVTLGKKPTLTKAGEGLVAGVRSRANELASAPRATGSAASQMASRIAGRPTEEAVGSERSRREWALRELEHTADLLAAQLATFRDGIEMFRGSDRFPGKRENLRRQLEHIWKPDRAAEILEIATAGAEE
jgi:hypothetical protein